MRNRSKFASIAFLGLLLATIPFWDGGDRRSEEAQTSQVLDALPGAAVASAFADGLSSGPNIPAVRSAILPHHLTAQSLLVDLIERLPDVAPSTIVVIGPDHQNAGSSVITTTEDDWQSGGARYSINRRVAEQLRSADLLTANNDVIRQEHSVLVPMVFLSHRYPSAQFVLLAVRSGFDRARLSSFAGQLDAVLGPNDLVIASVDFSHYLSLAQAEQEDQQSLELLQAGDPDALKNIPADSPAALAVSMRFAQRRGASKLTILKHQNSAQILGDPTLQSTTSYFTAVFSAQ